MGSVCPLPSRSRHNSKNTERKPGGRTTEVWPLCANCSPHTPQHHQEAARGHGGRLWWSRMTAGQQQAPGEAADPLTPHFLHMWEMNPKVTFVGKHWGWDCHSKHRMCRVKIVNDTSKKVVFYFLSESHTYCALHYCYLIFILLGFTLS